MTLTLDELALRRYAQRHGDPEVEISGSKAHIHLHQMLTNDAGDAAARATITLTGCRAFGHRVEFDEATCIAIEGAQKLADLNYLKEMANHLLEVLKDLCQCGQLMPACDCCRHCSSKGSTSTNDGPIPCIACGGRGYIGA